METTNTPSNPYATPTPPIPGSSAPTSNPVDNPYAPPSADVSYSGDATADAELTRRELLKHEASIRSIGTLYWLSFAGFLLMTLVAPFMPTEEGVDRSAMLITAAVFALLTAVFYYLANGLRNLKPGVRIWVTLFACFGLLGFPLGTIVNGYILWLLHSEKGKRVMTAEYQDIIARTPHIRYETPLWLKLILGLLVLGVVLAIVAAVMS